MTSVTTSGSSNDGGQAARASGAGEGGGEPFSADLVRVAVLSKGRSSQVVLVAAGVALVVRPRVVAQSPPSVEARDVDVAHAAPAPCQQPVQEGQGGPTDRDRGRRAADRRARCARHGRCDKWEPRPRLAAPARPRAAGRTGC
eukprot:747241-Hanusia_phi.AAC.2